MNVFKKGFGPFGPQDLNSLLKGLLIAVAGAVLTFAATAIQQYGNSASAVHYGIYFAILSLVVNALRKSLDGIKE